MAVTQLQGLTEISRKMFWVTETTKLLSKSSLVVPRLYRVSHLINPELAILVSATKQLMSAPFHWLQKKVLKPYLRQQNMPTQVITH